MKDKVLYLMPGMGGKPEIFDALTFPAGWKIVRMAWLMPERDETLEDYVSRLISFYEIKPGAVMLGMSFGGIIVNEISRKIPVEKLILISTVKHYREMPPLFRFARIIKAENILPYSLIRNPGKLLPFAVSKKMRKRISFYQKYMGLKERYYFYWSVKRILNWKGTMPQVPYIHIHGTADHIFPYKYLRNPVTPVPDAGHLMILTHPRAVGKHIKAFLAD